MNPSIGNAYSLGTFDQQWIRFPHENAVDLTVLHVDDQVVDVPKKNSAIRIDLQSDELRNFFEQFLTIPICQKCRVW